MCMQHRVASNPCEVHSLGRSDTVSVELNSKMYALVYPFVFCCILLALLNRNAYTFIWGSCVQVGECRMNLQRFAEPQRF